jgi:hypothetical protein
MKAIAFLAAVVGSVPLSTSHAQVVCQVIEDIGCPPKEQTVPSWDSVSRF